MKKLVIMVMVLMVALLSGCTSYETEIEELKADNSELTSEVTKIKASVARLTHQLELITGDIETLENKSEYKVALVSVYESGYATAETKFGPLAFIVENVEAYLSGYTVDLLIGNPNYVSFNGLSLTFTFYCTDFLEKSEEFTLDISDRIVAGAWNKVTIIAPNISSEMLGFISIGVRADQVWLKRS